MSNPHTTSVCVVCHRPTTMRCSRCQRTWYCSRQHSDVDWSRHSRECMTSPMNGPNTIDISSFDRIVDPSQFDPSEYLRQNINITGILFDPQSDRPQTVTVACRPGPKTSGQTNAPLCPTPLLQQFFTASQPQSIILTTGMTGENLRHPLHIFFCPTALAQGMPVNKAIMKITQGAARKPWCGTVVVLKFNGTRRMEYSEAGMNDLTTLSAYFLSCQ